MTNALVGHTGFVGGNLVAQRTYGAAFHRPTIGAIDGREFGTLVVAGAPGEKWRANAHPEDDAAAVDALIGHLRAVRAERVVLISTVDVYPDPCGVDEATEPTQGGHERAYGRNRLRLEEFVRGHFGRSLVLRLPGLFGPGLKKNLVFDLRSGRPEEFCHRDSRFQFYDLRRLSDDMDTALGAGLTVANLATEPVSAARIAREVFGRELTRTDVAQVAYDMRTRHAAVFGATPPYLMDAAEVLGRLTAFAGVPA